ncbi:MAG: LacI family DNA-binding transcriptional regulator [Verrucomicrobiota bacterium]
MPATEATVTIKDIAQAAGLSLAAVSYALRNSPKIPQKTREHVQEVARKLGYRPNPRISSLMAHIRRAHARPASERLAFVWVHTSRARAARDPFLRDVFAGAQRRAEQGGFALEEFWTNEAGMTDQRLQQIIQARGIVGVVLSPVLSSEASLALDWDWSAFAVAVIGNVTWTPELHHAGHHHFLGMRMTLLELAQLGCSRPVALIEPTTNERAKRAWEAAFLTHHPARAEGPALLRMLGMGDFPSAAAWVRRQKPDALIVSTTQLLAAPGLRKACRDLKLPIVTLHWSDEAAGVGGIDQCYDRIAGHAVDLVATQLNSNEAGVPDLPRIMLYAGRWVAPRMPRSALELPAHQ